jgi:hypothetical protein
MCNSAGDSRSREYSSRKREYSSNKECDDDFRENENGNEGEEDEDGNEGEICLNGYSTFGVFKFSLEPDTVIQIRSYNYFPAEVINLAIDIYYQIATSTFGESNLALSPRILKGAKKVRRIYICFYKALNDIGVPVDPIYLATLVNLPKTEIGKAFNETPLPILTEPEKLIPFYLHQIGRSEELETALSWLSSLRTYPKGQEYIDNMPVKNICLGIILNCLAIQRKDMAEIAPKCFSAVPYMTQCQKGVQSCFQEQIQYHDLRFWWLQTDDDYQTQECCNSHEICVS